MAGGIQKGTEAGSIESKELDGDVKIISLAIDKAQTSYFYEVGHKNMLSERFSDAVKQAASLPELEAMGITLGCMPDGGMWFDGPRSATTRKLIAGFEAKHQQDGGNAIERWCKNYMLCKGMNPDVKYITFMSGPGATPNGVLYKFGHSMVAANGSNCIFYYQPDGFSQEDIFNKMVHHLDLDLTFDQIKPYIGKKSTFTKLFDSAKKTTEELVAEQAEKQQAIQADNTFISFLQNETDPLTLVWRKIDRDDRVDARDEIVSMIQNGYNKSEIVEVLKQYYLN